MKILVAIKQVPDLESKFQVAGDGKTIETTDLVFRINEYDEFAIEEAVQTKTAHEGAELVVISVGPAKATEAIKKALAMGCDRAIHVVDAEANQKESLQIASLIHKAIEAEAFDLIFTGMQSQDLGSGQVGILLGEMLEVNSITCVVDFNLEEGKIKVKRELEGGLQANIEASLPALVTCQLGLNTPRYPTLPNIMKAKKKEIKSVEVASLEFAPAKTEVTSLYPPVKKGGATYLEGSSDQMAEDLIAILKDKTTVLA